jgi:hypothetical protein
MKKFYIMLAGLAMTLSAGAEQKSITEDFNNWGGKNYAYLYNLTSIPENWAYIAESGAEKEYEYSKVSDGDFCIKGAQNYYLTLVTYAYAGSEGGNIVIDIKRRANSGADPAMELWKMSKSDGSYTFVEKLCDVEIPAGVNGSSFVTTSAPDNIITEDGYIGIKFIRACVDNYCNSWEEGGDVVSTYSYSGSVTDSEGAPIADVTAQLSGANNYSATSDANGAFSFTEVKPGHYTLSLSREGYKSFSQEVDIEADVTDMAVTLQTEVSVLYGNVIDQVYTYNLCSDAIAYLYDGDTLVARCNAPEGAYRFTINGVLQSSYTLKATAPGYEANSIEVSFTYGTEKFQGIYLTPLNLVYDPADGSYLDELSYVTVSANGKALTPSIFSDLELRDDNGNLINETYTSAVGEDGAITWTLSDPVAPAYGIYTLTLPEGSFIVGESDSPAVTLKYTLGVPFTIAYNKGYYNYMEQPAFLVQGVNGQVITLSRTYSSCSLSKKDSDKKFDLQVVEDSDNGIYFVINDESQRDAFETLGYGTYVMTIGEGFFAANDNQFERQVDVEFLVQSSAVEALSAADATVDIYTTSGMRVRRGVAPAEVNTLPAGIYILRSNAGTSKFVVK